MQEEKRMVENLKLIFVFYVVSFPVFLWGGVYNFKQPGSILTGSSPRGLAVGHFIRSSASCLAVADFGSSTFIGQSTPQSILNQQIPRIQVFTATSSGLSLLTEISTGWSPRGLATVPNLSGQDDLLVSCYDAGLLQMFGWDGAKFQKTDESPTLSQPVGVSYGTTKVGGAAFAAVAEYGANQISLYEIKNGKLGVRHDYNVPPGPAQVAVGDLHGDGVNEIVVACLGTGQLAVLRPSISSPNDLSSYTLTETLCPTPGANLSDLRIADINQDGRADLVTTDFTKNTVWIYLQHKDGTLVLQPPLTTSGAHPNGLAVANLNKGEAPVVVIANRDSDLLDLFQWNGSLFQALQSLKVASDAVSSFGPVEVAALDTKNSGTVDLVTTHMRTNSIKILTQEEVPTASPTPMLVSFGDLKFSENTTLCFPNPSRDGRLTFAFTLPTQQNVVIKIFDISGILVYSQAVNAGQTQAGVNQVSWNGVNQAGSRLASGIYIYNISSGNQSVTKKLALIR